MIKCEVIEKFNLKDFDKLKNIQRKSVDTYGMLYVGDVFECDENMAKYLSGGNGLNKVVVKIIEVQPREAKTKDEEKIIPLSEENVVNLAQEIEKHIKAETKPKATIKKKKTSKK